MTNFAGDNRTVEGIIENAVGSGPMCKEKLPPQTPRPLCAPQMTRPSWLFGSSERGQKDMTVVRSVHDVVRAGHHARCPKLSRPSKGPSKCPRGRRSNTGVKSRHDVAGIATSCRNRGE